MTLSATILDTGTTGATNDEIILEPGETFDVSSTVEFVDETIETVGGVEVELTKEVTFVTSENDVIVLENTALPTITIEIPDGAVLSAPDEWDNQIEAPTIVSTSGTIQSGFLTPTSSILVGSPDVVLVFDTPVTIILNDVSGTTAYKTPESTQWIIISGCTGTFENPDDPTEPNECSISDGVNTKIVTYHFTEFTGITPSTSSTGTSSGHGNTGVGSPRVFGSGSSGSSGGDTYYVPGDTTPRVFPVWFDNVSQWYREGKISAMEFLNAYQWVTENIMK